VNATAPHKGARTLLHRMYRRACVVVSWAILGLVLVAGGLSAGLLLLELIARLVVLY